MKTNIRHWQMLGVSLIILTTVTACGGSGGDAPALVPAAPTVAPAAATAPPAASTGAPVAVATATPFAPNNTPVPTSIPPQRSVPDASAAAQVVTATPESVAPSASALGAAPSANSQAAPQLLTLPVFNKLNLNTAKSDQFAQAIPGIAANVASQLSQHNAYSSIQEFRTNIGKAADANTIAQIEKYVYVPIDVNNADAATLRQIPGVTEEIAAELIAARPFADNDAFLARLSIRLAPNDVTLAQNYLAYP